MPTSNNGRKRKVCVVLVDRANYGRLKPVMHEITQHPQLQLQLIAAGSMVLERFQRPVHVVRDDGFAVDSEVYMELEGSTPATMAKSIGLGISEFANEFSRLAPDLVVLIGDRYEALAACIAAAYMNLCIVHVQGGEVSGSIDESARHAITKFAQYHFPATKGSVENLLGMGERPETILGFGCPSSDIARTLDRQLLPEVVNLTGAGCEVDVSARYLLVVYHPTTTEFGDERAQMETILEALGRIKTQTILLWPNIDAGSDHISKAIRVFRDQHKPDWLRVITNLMPERYLQVLANAACAVGNSSSFVRDSSYFGTPIVNVGHRQLGRERSENVLDADIETGAIEAGIRRQLAHGRFAPSTLYGDGHVARRIVESLAQLEPYIQKRLHTPVLSAAVR